MKKEITQESFSRFLEKLSPDPERAGEEYERLRFVLHRYFSLRHCSFADELADETINRVILKISTEEIENTCAYCLGVARNVYRESLRKQRTHLDIDEVTIAVKAPEQPSLSGECLDKCLERLSFESRELLFDYFSQDKQEKIDLRRRISKSMTKTQTALRMQVFRSKQKLRNCVHECMNLSPTVT